MHSRVCIDFLSVAATERRHYLVFCQFAVNKTNEFVHRRSVHGFVFYVFLFVFVFILFRIVYICVFLCKLTSDSFYSIA